MTHRLLLLLSLALVLPGCGSFLIDADGIDGFSPSSQVWQVEASSGANRHSFVLTNISGYCGKKKQAEQDRIDAQARHEQRLDDGAGICESEDQRLDDLADAYGPLERDGAAFLFITIAREDETALDAITAPEVGEFRQVGAGGQGRFTASYQRFNGTASRNRADAYTCLGADEVDETNWQEFLNEVDPTLMDSWNLDAGILELATSGDDAWSVDLQGDLLDGGTTAGSLEASFVAKRCEVPATADTLGL